jgi:hexosaminidase
LTLISHHGLGARVTYVTPPNDRYNSGDLTLVDGQFGARPWRGNQWVGFDTNIVKIRLDLGRKTKIRGLEIGFLDEPSSWIHVPSEAVVFTDRKTYKPTKVSSEHTAIKCKVKTRFIMLNLKGLEAIPPGLPGEGNTPWIFVDEIVIK